MIIDELYHGNLHPSEDIVPKDKEYRKVNKKVTQILDALEAKLSKEEMDMVNELHAVLVDNQLMELRATFEYGFSLGLVLTSEAYHLRGAEE